MSKILKPEDIREIDWCVLPKVLGTLSLYNLSYLYDYYKKTLDLSTKTIKDVYVDKSKCTSWELENHRVQVNRKCMYNVKLSERMIFLIEEECKLRNVYKRFIS